LSEFRFLLGDLARAFPEPAVWNGLAIIGRFRSGPFDVPLAGTNAGIAEVQTWFWCERAVIAAMTPGMPRIGDLLIIRGRSWEIVEEGEDDLGELSFRLIKSDGDLTAATHVDTADAADKRRRPGRPSRRADILSAFEVVAAACRIDPAEPVSRVFGAVRAQITGCAAPQPGLGNKTLRKTLAPLIEARRNQQK
jgi:hypothetical protein